MLHLDQHVLFRGGREQGLAVQVLVVFSYDLLRRLGVAQPVAHARHRGQSFGIHQPADCAAAGMAADDNVLHAQADGGKLDGGRLAVVARAVGGTMLPTLRTMNSSPGSVLVIRFGSMRESAQVMKQAMGCCPFASRWNSSRCELKTWF